MRAPGRAANSDATGNGITGLAEQEALDGVLDAADERAAGLQPVEAVATKATVAVVRERLDPRHVAAGGGGER